LQPPNSLSIRALLVGHVIVADPAEAARGAKGSATEYRVGERTYSTRSDLRSISSSPVAMIHPRRLNCSTPTAPFAGRCGKPRFPRGAQSAASRENSFPDGCRSAADARLLGRANPPPAALTTRRLPRPRSCSERKSRSRCPEAKIRTGVITFDRGRRRRPASMGGRGPPLNALDAEALEGLIRKWRRFQRQPSNATGRSGG